MKKIALISLVFAGLIILFVHCSQLATAAESYKLTISPVPCSTAPGLGDCPTELQEAYQNQPCVSSYELFSSDPVNQHFWAVDPEVTAQGKADERARQFIYWAINRNSIDEHPILKTIWGFSRNVVLFFIVLVAAVSGIGIIVGTRSNFDFKVKVWPLIVRLGTLLLYVSFSATIVLLLIQVSEIFMKFFIEKLGGQDLFNIYFAGVSVEKNYVDFVGCRDLNFRVQEAVETELFLLKITNVIYYLMGSMLILRKIILWFLLFVSPFLALLAPFVFIRNIGWIWIGVFFQWLFYGPLFALFLGGLSSIWKAGIPFPFDFSRVNSITGYIYPTATNIVFGGPAQVAAQKIGALNNGNYIDTFVEYVISLLMLLAVTFFPWWLLRIFRDYCCEGIEAAKNILMSMYDQMHGGPTPSPSLSPVPTNIGATLNMSKQVEMPIKVHLETMEEIKKTKTEDITRSLNISTKKLTDVANFETNKQTQQTIKQNIDYLSNPMKANTPTERQKFMNLRTELFSRAVKKDVVAQRLLSTISSSKIEQLQRRQELIKSIPTPAVSKTLEKPIEQTITIPATVSIEDYESVKKMWRRQYEQGEVPVAENIKTRSQWVEQDIVFITNTLNKLLSADEKIRQQGLDDLGYILPIFMINNMRGEELLVYLKAKLEAAKIVAEIINKEKEVTEKLKAKSEEEFVDVDAPKKAEAAKTMKMAEELKI